MPFLVRPTDNPLVFVDSADLAAYLAAGWVQATAAQISAWNDADPYHGTQSAPSVKSLAPRVDGNAPMPSTKHVR